MTYIPSIRELGYLNKTSLLRKAFKIRTVTGNAGQKDWLSFVSLSHHINDGKATGYSEKKTNSKGIKIDGTKLAIDKCSINPVRYNSYMVNEVFKSTL